MGATLKRYTFSEFEQFKLFYHKIFKKSIVFRNICQKIAEICESQIGEI